MLFIAAVFVHDTAVVQHAIVLGPVVHYRVLVSRRAVVAGHLATLMQTLRVRDRRVRLVLVLNEIVLIVVRAMIATALRVHVRLVDRHICEALHDRLETRGGVIYDALSFLAELFRFFLGSHNACPVQVHQNARLVVANEADSLPYRLGSCHPCWNVRRSLRLVPGNGQLATENLPSTALLRQVALREVCEDACLLSGDTRDFLGKFLYLSYKVLLPLEVLVGVRWRQVRPLFLVVGARGVVLSHPQLFAGQCFLVVSEGGVDGAEGAA